MDPTTDTADLLDALTRAVLSPSVETLVGFLGALAMLALRVYLVQRTTSVAVASAVQQVPTDLDPDDEEHEFAVALATQSATDKALEAGIVARPRAANLKPKMRAKVRKALKKRARESTRPPVA